MQFFDLSDIEASMESIAPQSGDLFRDLVAAVTTIRTAGKYAQPDVDAAGIPAIVKRHTKMTCSFRVAAPREVGINAYVLLPFFDRNHPFFQEWVNHLDSKLGIDTITALKGKARGYVDLQRSTVGGVYADIKGDVVIGYELFRSAKFTPEMVAGIIMHELGHLFTYFVYLGTTVLNAHIVGDAARMAVGIDDYKERVVTLERAADSCGIKIDANALAKQPKALRSLVTQTAFVSEIGRTLRTETGASYYEERSCEQLADNFAMQHGAGIHLALGLDSLTNQGFHEGRIPDTAFVMLEIAKICQVIAASAMIPGLILIPMLVFFFSLPTAKTYDDPQARIRLTRQTLQGALKDGSLPKDRQRQILEDIAAIEAIEAKWHDRRTLMQFLVTTIRPGQRKAMAQEVVMKHLEDLLHNDLFVIAARANTEL